MMIENERTQRTRLEGELTSRKQEVQKLKAFIQISNTEKSETVASTANITSSSGAVASNDVKDAVNVPRHVRTKTIMKKPEPTLELDLPPQQDENSSMPANSAPPKQDTPLAKEDTMNMDLDFGGNPGALKMNTKRRLRRDNLQTANQNTGQGQEPSAGDCNQQ